MPAYQVTGPDGKKYRVDTPEGASANDAIAYVYNTYYMGKQTEPKRPGFIKSIGLGAESMLSSGRTALESVLDPEEAAQAGLERQREISEKYGEGLTLEQLKQIYEQEGLLAAAKEAVSEIPSAIGAQLPNIGAIAGGARLGAMAGAPLGPYGAGAGALLGAVAPSFLQQLGGNIERQAIEQQARGEPVEISPERATAAAVPQAALDVISTYIPLGRTIAGKLFGKEVQALLGAGEKEAAEALAKESLATVLAKGTAIGAAAEIPTEVTQQALERAQAGLSLTDEDALKEYGETAFQVSLLAPIGAVGRIAERSAARRGAESAPERREEEPAPPAETPVAEAPAVTEEEPTTEVSPREIIERRAEELRRQEARRRPLSEQDQMGLPLEGGEIAPSAVLEPPVEPRSQMFVSGEEALADAIRQRELETDEEIRPRSRAYREEAKDLGIKLDRKGNVKPNQAVFEQPEALKYELVYADSSGNEVVQKFDTVADQQDVYNRLIESGVPEENIVKRREVAPSEQFALNLPGMPMERLAPRDRVLRAMAITEDKKNIPNLKFATQLRPMELQKAIGDLKKEGAIAFNNRVNEWELTPVGAERVRSGPEVKPPSPRRGAALPVPPARPAEPTIAESGERGVAGVSTAPARVDVGTQQVQPALEAPPPVAVPVQEKTTNELFDEIQSIKSQAMSLLTSNGKVPAYGSPKRQQYDALKQQEEVLKQQWNESSKAEERAQRQAARFDERFKTEEAIRQKELTGEELTPAPVDRMALIRRAQEQRVARQAINEVEGRRSRLRTQAIDAFDNDQIDERTYTQITEQLKRPVPNFGVVEKVLSGEVKPGRKGIKFQRTYNPQVGTPQFKNWFGDSKAVDQEGKPLVLYRGAVGAKNIPEGALEGKAREGYATFASTSPQLAATYGQPEFEGEAGAVTPLYVKANKLIEFPVQINKEGYRRFDKFEFDRQAQRLRPGEVLVARQVIDYGPRANVETDPERLYSYPSDIYAWGKGTSVKSAVGNVGAFDTTKESILAQRGKIGAGLPIDRARAVADDAVRTWTNAPKVVVASSVNDPVIPENIRKQIPEDAPGFYVNETTYVLADRAKDEATVRGTVFHESLGHYGLEQEFQGGLQDVMQGIYDTNPKMQAAAKTRMEKFGLDAATAVEEVLAERSETGPIKESWLRAAYGRVAAYIRNFMRQRGLVSTYSDNDVNQILKQAHRRVIKGKKAPYDPFNPAVRYQRSPEAQRKGDRAFVNAVGKISQSLPAATKETYEAARNAASNLPTGMRRVLYTLYDPHEMGRIYSKDLKSDVLEKLWKNANQEGTELRKMQDTIMDNMTKWGKVMEKYSEAEQNKIRDLFMATTTTKTKVQVVTAKGKVKEKEVFGVEVLDLVDPARNINWKADVDHPLYKQLSAIFNRDPALKGVYKGLRLGYVDNALAVEKQLQQYLTPAQWQKILSKLNEQRVRVYLPLFRQGNFKLSYTDRAGNPVALQFESSAERSAARQEILREGVDPNSIIESRVEERRIQDIPPSSFLADIVGDMKEAGVNDDIVADVIEHYLDYLPTDSVLQRGRRRQEVTPAGYSNDVLKAYANVSDSYARRIVKMEFQPKYFELQEELKVATANARDRGVISSDVAEDLNYYATRYIDFVQNPNLSGIGAQLGYASFQLYLGANISTAVTNVIDTPTVLLSRLLGKGHKIGSIGNSLVKAGSIFFSKQKSPEMQELIQRGLDSGIIREQRLQDIAEFKNLSSRWEKLKANVDRITSWAFAKSDMFNREVGLIAAYDLQKAKNKTPPDVFDQAAFDVAQSVVADVYGSSFPKATAPIMGSDIAKTALTFKRFGIKRINLLQAAYKEATRDLDPNDPDSKVIRDAARKEIIGYFATAFVSAGVQGMPLVGAGAALVTVLNGILGDDDEPYDADFALREAVGLFAYKGPINYLFGIDIASRTGWTGMFWREDPKRMAEVGPITYAVEQALGPAYSYAVGLPRVAEYIEDGNYQRAFEQLMPRAVSNVSKGFRYATEGALTAKGVPLVEDVNAYNAFMQIFGFRPSDVAEAGDIAGATKRMESKIFQRRNAIIARAAVARMSGDVDGFRESVEEAVQFSRKYPSLGITYDTLYEAVQRRTKKLATSVNGVTVNPKVARGIYEELGVTDEVE